MTLKSVLTIIGTLVCSMGFAQQAPDTTYLPPGKPTNQGQGITVAIDEAHHNFHTADGRYRPFTNVLRHSGYTIVNNTKTFSGEHLEHIDILVIANALNETNLAQWQLPTPSAFTREEIEAVTTWVRDGGSLFLIADHMPFAGAAGELAESFGFRFYNGFALDTAAKFNEDIFTVAGKTLVNREAIGLAKADSFATFTGQAFDLPPNAIPILKFDARHTILLPERAWVFNTNTSAVPAAGRSQLALLKFGEGKIVVSGEAAMFTAQIAGGGKVGMNSPVAKYNYLLLLALMKWLKNK